ncbi:Macrolide export protein MacA [Caulifigura coniformis]|uniref:Macrolide export protein MacA n=1 Tax=Caulifigura coniformis TaxID=2527983 RepID=A0A517SJ22_9PLAN|nr:efflux RND transporter periplasmic adaptor subunit [Caulifigura coniformis]QDT56109.1 Macrolide export protein MacA [Caulifigura coniformis]
MNTPAPRDALATLQIKRRDERRGPSFLGRLVQLIGLLVLLAALGIGGFVFAQRQGWVAASDEWIPQAIRTLKQVRVTKVTVETGRSADAVVVATGYLESYQQANIGARAAGRIEKINVEEGTRVQAGEVIAVLDHKDIDAALAGTKAAVLRAEAELAEQEVAIARAKKDLERKTKLKESSALTESQFDETNFQYQAMVAKRGTLEAAVKLAQAKVLETEQMIENMIVRAPFTATVINKTAEVGESILPGGMGEASGRGSVVMIADLDRLEVDCDVKEDYIGRVLSGAPTEVAVDAVPNRRYHGLVRKVIPMGDRARATIKVKVEITDADARLFPNMSAKVYFLPEPGEKPPEAKEKRIFCDSAAIIGTGANRAVWQLGDDLRVRRVAITGGEDRDGRTEILEGLKGGERVVVDPSPELHEEQLVKVRD